MIRPAVFKLRLEFLGCLQTGLNFLCSQLGSLLKTIDPALQFSDLQVVLVDTFSQQLQRRRRVQILGFAGRSDNGGNTCQGSNQQAFDKHVFS